MHRRQLHCCRGEARHCAIEVRRLVVTLDDVLIRLCSRQTASGHTIAADTHPRTLTHSHRQSCKISSAFLFLNLTCYLAVFWHSILILKDLDSRAAGSTISGHILCIPALRPHSSYSKLSSLTFLLFPTPSFLSFRCIL